MSNPSLSEDNVLCSNEAPWTFWQPGGYKRTTKRIEDGFRLCNDLVQLIQERCDIEKNYAKSLHGWSEKWTQVIGRGPEFGSMEKAVKSMFTEADRLSNLHLKIRESLIDKVVNEIKAWQKENYHKSIKSGLQLKERKEIEDLFRKIQKPWLKALDRVNKCKNEYHSACKLARHCAIQERNASSDTSISPDQLKKITDRVSKAKEEVAKTKDKYELALKETDQYRPKYVIEMTQLFERCQGMEEKRLCFFRDPTLFNVHECLSKLYKDPELPLIYEEFRHTIQSADAAKDLKWWSDTYGTGMVMNWPQFEEFSEEFREIIKDTKVKKVNLSSDGITLINQHKFTEELPEWSESFATNDSLIDNGEPGISVRALYDYEGAEADELSFKQGDVFEKLEDEDEQGWCKGRKDNRVGLYPANYVQVLTEKE